MTNGDKGKFVTIWVVTSGGGGIRQTVKNVDKGGGRVKNWDFYDDILFEWPLTYFPYIYP